MTAYDDLLAPVEETDLFDPDKFFLRHLSLGFEYLQKSSKIANSSNSDTTMERRLLSQPIVNIVDPTASTAMSASQQQKNSNQQQQPLQLLSQTIATILSRDHGNCLHNVPFTNYRSGADGVIAHLGIQVQQSPTAGVLETTGCLSSLDPTEWHAAPYCHVYIAACHNLEHYRTTVKPSIQIFLSQLQEAAGSSTASGDASANNPNVGPTAAASSSNSPTKGGSSSSSSAGNTTTTPYLIVYCPTGQRPAAGSEDGTSNASTTGGRQSRVAAFASRVAEARSKARQRMGRETSNATASSTHTSGTTSGESDDEGDSLPATTTQQQQPQQPQQQQQLLTKVEREIVRRLTADFSSGRVCTFTSLLQQSSEDGTNDDQQQQQQQWIQQLEWDLFTKELGATVVEGFQMRCRRYDEELKRLGEQHAAATKAAAAASSSSDYWKQQSALGNTSNNNLTADAAAAAADFQLTHFLLVKESFAFTYEQMCMYAEALLQYEELQALLPDFQAEYFLTQDDTSASDKKPSGGKRSFIQVALAGDTLAFRTRLQSMGDDIENLVPVVHEMEHYILVRQTDLLFRLKSSVGVVTRCKAFVQKLYEFKRAQLVQSSSDAAAAAAAAGGASSSEVNTATTTAMLHLNKWAFEFCWDVTMASRKYSSMANEQQQQSELFARSVCDVLDFARYRFSDLGKLQFPDYQPPQFFLGGSDALPPEWQNAWKTAQQPWVEPEPSAIEQADRGTSGELPENGVIATALSTRESFERIHAQLTKVLASFMESCGRKRYAACLRLAVIDVDVRGNKLLAAEEELRSIAKTYSGDNWNACSFFLLFQLVKLQRQSETAVTYLDTLVQCFSGGSAAPRKALLALFEDLLAVVRCGSTAGSNLEMAPIFKIAIGLEDFSMLNVVGSDRNLLKKVYSVGDTVPVTVCLFSQLPQDVVAKKIRVLLVPFQTYVSKVEDSIEITAEDVFHVISLSDVTVQPGRNDLTLRWTPGTTGQFILSALSLEWENCTFTYPAKGMKRPTVRVDVLPCDPTQSLRIEPNFLVPGHEQPVQIVFETGNDTVDSGTVQLVGSSGVVLAKVDEQDCSKPSTSWQSIMALELPACKAGHTEILHVFVKSEVDKEAGGSAAALHVQATTLFRPDVGESAKTQDEEEKEERLGGGCMESSLSASVTTLGKAAFVVDDAEAVSYGADGLVIHASLRCNAPSPFVLQKWSLDLPSCLELAGSSSDLNASLLNSTVSPGERLSLAFHCRARNELPASFEGTLHITYDNGAGTTFSDSLAVELDHPLCLPKKKAPTGEVSIELSPFPPAGLVGSPIDIACSIDTSAVSSLLNGTKDIRYAVHLESDSWLLHGKTEGILKTAGSGGMHKLKFVAIPTCPGLIEEYISVSLTVEGEDGQLLELPIKVNQAAPFDAFDPPDHTTVAFLDN